MLQPREGHWLIQMSSQELFNPLTAGMQVSVRLQERALLAG